MVTSFVNQNVYAFTVRYASLIIFAVLGIIVLPYLKGDIAEKDTDLLLAILTMILSLFFAVLSHSGFGAVFIPSDLALICYATKHLTLTDRSLTYLGFAGACPVILWYSHVRWSYNFNMAGFAFMLMAFFAMILTGSIKYPLKHRKFIRTIIFLTAFILSMLYHSRTAMFGMIMFIIVYLFFDAFMGNRRLYYGLFVAATAGAVVFTWIYIRLADAAGDMRILYKDVFSGRQAIWTELWEAFSHSPLTGIGSGYELKSFGIFEVHNGMFDILTVHGMVVFCLVFSMLWRTFGRAYAMEKDKTPDRTRRIAISAAFAMMFTSFFENFFTVPPYNIFFMTFLMMACTAKE